MMQLLLAAALVAPASAATNKTRPVLLTSFAANSWSHNYASGSFNQTVVGPVVVDAGRLSVSQESPLADGRSTRVVLDYAAGAAGGVWSLQPFFGERVCYIYPLPAAGPQQHETFAMALSDIWCPQGAEANVPCMPAYEQSAYEGEGTIDGKPCSLWLVHVHEPPKTIEDIVFCVAESGALLSVNLTFNGLQTLRFGNPPKDHVYNTTAISHNVFSNLSTAPPASAFAKPSSGCVDLRPIKEGSDDHDGQPEEDGQLVNHPDRIARIDAAARTVGWRAGPNPNFDGKTVLEASASLGLKLGRERGSQAWSLPLPSAEHRAGRGEVEGAADPPVAFDAREKWGDQCSSIATIRNQGACGSCWAFAAAETLADRLCIGAKGSAPYDGLKLSTEYLIDCDHHDHGCSGGMLDDAWFFLRDNGLPEEACDPYTHCPYPAVSSCKAPAPPPTGHCDYTNHSTLDATPFRTFGCDNAPECCGQCTETTAPLCVASAFEGGLCHLFNATASAKPLTGSTVCKPMAAPPPPPPPPTPPTTCPSSCAKAGTPLTLHKAENAYSVGMPGDVVSIQRELMAHGPIEVGFSVFSDFMSYRNGTYSRTAGAQLRGGHAVKLTGWGVDEKGVDYWVIANSWSPEFGLDGFFHIRRGTNECGVETTPAAGLPKLKLSSL